MITVTGLAKAFTVEWTPSRELDVVGYLVHWVPEAQISGGTFTPSALNLKHEGPENKIQFNDVTPGVYYVRVAAYDSFEDVSSFTFTNLNYSAASPVTVTALTVLPDELYGPLRTDFWVKDSIFSFTHNDLPTAASTTLNYTAGSIIRGDTEYEFSGGFLLTAHNKYVIATLTEGTPNGTAVLTVRPFGTAFSPALTSNQIVLAVTSATPTSGTNNYVCFMRQANSVEYEGALIKNLTADNIEAGTLTGSTIQTAASGERFVVSKDSKSAEFYDTNGTRQVSIGTNLNWYNGSAAYGVFGSVYSTELAIYGVSGANIAIMGDSGTGIAIYGTSTMYIGVSGSGGYGVRGECWQNIGGFGGVGVLAVASRDTGVPFRIQVNDDSADRPTRTAEAGSFYTTLTGVLYYNDTGGTSGWEPLAGKTSITLTTQNTWYNIDTYSGQLILRDTAGGMCAYMIEPASYIDLVGTAHIGGFEIQYASGSVQIRCTTRANVVINYKWTKMNT